MAHNWAEFTFSELIKTGALEIGDGYRAKLSELGGDGPIFLRAGHVRETHIDLAGVERFDRRLAGAVSSKMSRTGDVIVTTKGNSTGRVSFVDASMPPFVYSPHLSYWRCLDTQKIVPAFLRYWSRSRQFHTQLAGLAASTDMAPYLSLVDQRRLRIALPYVEEQHEISEVLSALDYKIELNRRMDETLEAIAREIFKSWFPDNADNLPSTVREEFNLTMGQSPPGDTYNQTGDGVPFFQGCTDFGLRYPDARIYCKAPTRFAEAGDTLISVRAPVGDLNMAKQNCSIGRGIAALRHKSGSRSYTYYAAKSLKHQLDAFEAEGTVFGSIGKDQFKALTVCAPSAKAIRDFEQFAKPIDDLIERNHTETEVLSALRDALLPKLMSGEIRIKQAEKIVEAHA
jgi:type I restriction enzyme, S subunit